MTNLSPAAQTVLDAANNELDHAPWDVSYLAKPVVAAALRAVAYIVAPAIPVCDHCCDHQSQNIRHKLLAITAELENYG
jgi:hypothetical protein